MYKKRPSITYYNDEQFRDMPGNPFYMISDKGRVWSHKRKRYLALSETTPNVRRKSGEDRVYISMADANGRKQVNLHRLREEVWPELYELSSMERLDEVDGLISTKTLEIATLNAERSTLIKGLSESNFIEYAARILK